MNRWPKVALGEILQRSVEAALLDPDREYHELTIRIWGKGNITRMNWSSFVIFVAIILLRS